MQKFFDLKIVFMVGLMAITLPFFVDAAIATGSSDEFFVEQEFDAHNREQITAKVKKVSSHAYFYVEIDWWDDLTTDQRNTYSVAISNLAEKFDDEIYPIMTDTYGNEWKPGIDSDSKITVLLHEASENVAGYFREKDERSKLQVSDSNEREMIYLSGRVLDATYPESYLAHEFMHLITYNQKEKVNFKEDDIWLNELRAEYAPTLLGYDDEYIGSNLQRRIGDFSEDSNNSLIKWDGQTADYGVVNLFAQYLVEQYGIEILTESLSSDKFGLDSLNDALNELNADKIADETFIDWQIAISANDCKLGEEYCYKNEYLSAIKPVPSLIYLPSTKEAHINLVYSIEKWSGNWYKIVGGNKGFKLEFEALDDNFVIPYFVEQNNNIQYLDFLDIEDGKGTIEIPYFGQDNKSITLMPSIEGDYEEGEFRFSLNLSTVEPEEELDANIEELLARIVELQAQIKALLIKLQELRGDMCSSINNNLYFGLKNNAEVKCLQQLLVDEGVYPQAIVNGNFLSLTRQAVIRFQDKYRFDILTPIGLSRGSGYVGSMTRQKINELLR